MGIPDRRWNPEDLAHLLDPILGRKPDDVDSHPWFLRPSDPLLSDDESILALLVHEACALDHGPADRIEDGWPGLLHQALDSAIDATWGELEVEGQSESPEHELWLAVAKRDPEATAELFIRRCGPMIRALERRYRCADLLGELYLHLAQDDWRRWRTWEGRASLKTWIEQIAVRLCLGRFRSQPKAEAWTESIEIEASLECQPEDPFHLARRDAHKAIALLDNPRQRRLMELHVVLDLPLDAVALRMGIKRNNADQIKHQAVCRMREILLGGSER